MLPGFGTVATAPAASLGPGDGQRGQAYAFAAGPVLAQASLETQLIAAKGGPHPGAEPVDSSEPLAWQRLVGKHPLLPVPVPGPQARAVHIRALQADSSKPETKVLGAKVG